MLVSLSATAEEVGVLDEGDSAGRTIWVELLVFLVVGVEELGGLEVGGIPRWEKMVSGGVFEGGEVGFWCVGGKMFEKKRIA